MSISSQAGQMVKFSITIWVIALLGSLFMVITISRSIITLLKRTTKVIGQISLGDTSGSIPAGQPVNCSSIKKCGVQDCPSYGKEDLCWVKAVLLQCLNIAPVQLIEGSVAKSDSGSEIANKTAAVLGEIMRSVSKVNDLVDREFGKY